MSDTAQQPPAQVYWRIRRADGKYWNRHSGCWVSYPEASNFLSAPIYSMLEHVDDPTARLVKVVVRRVEHTNTRDVNRVISQWKQANARRRKAGKSK